MSKVMEFNRAQIIFVQKIDVHNNDNDNNNIIALDSVSKNCSIKTNPNQT